jgi:hypothetical protein
MMISKAGMIPSQIIALVSDNRLLEARRRAGNVTRLALLRRMEACGYFTPQLRELVADYLKHQHGVTVGQVQSAIREATPEHMPADRRPPANSTIHAAPRWA